MKPKNFEGSLGLRRGFINLPKDPERRYAECGNAVSWTVNLYNALGRMHCD